MHRFLQSMTKDAFHLMVHMDTSWAHHPPPTPCPHANDKMVTSDFCSTDRGHFQAPWVITLQMDSRNQLLAFIATRCLLVPF